MNMDTLKTYKKEDGSYLGVLGMELVPFPIKRIFFVSSADNKNCSRGSHAHYECRQLLACLSGKIEIQYENRDGKGKIDLNCGETFLHENLEWAELLFVEEKSTLLSLCSHEYDEGDYIRSYEEFLQVVTNT